MINLTSLSYSHPNHQLFNDHVHTPQSQTRTLMMQDASNRPAISLTIPGSFHSGDPAAHATSERFKERTGRKQITVVQHGSQNTIVS